MKRSISQGVAPTLRGLGRLGIGLLLLSGPAAGADVETAAGDAAQDEGAILTKLGFPSGSVRKVLAGDFVEQMLKSGSKRELSVALAFRVDLASKELEQRFDHALAIRDDPNTLAFGEIRGQGSVQDFRALRVDEKAARRWLHAEAGETLNLSSGEIATFQALRKRLEGSTSVADPVSAAVRRMLLNRYRAYRSLGLAGIAPYRRGSGSDRDAAGELRAASRAGPAQVLFTPALRALLVDDPKSRSKDFEESFYWIHYEAHGERVLILTHWLSAPEEGGFGVVQRQFYVSRSYDVEQSLLALIPVSAGTLVAFTNSTFTDQVDGFGGAMRRSVGRKLLASQLKGLYQKIRENMPHSK